MDSFIFSCSLSGYICLQLFSFKAPSLDIYSQVNIYTCKTNSALILTYLVSFRLWFIWFYNTKKCCILFSRSTRLPLPRLYRNMGCDPRLYLTSARCKYIDKIGRLHGSVGRAPARQPVGHRFKSRSSKFVFAHLFPPVGIIKVIMKFENWIKNILLDTNPNPLGILARSLPESSKIH